MKATKADVIKFMGWGAVIGIIVIILVGFTLFGWMTGGTAEEVTQEAVLEREAQICVAQFKEDPEFEKNLGEFKKIQSSWDRASYIEKGGWDKMPGEEESDYSVKGKCVELIEDLL